MSGAGKLGGQAAAPVDFEKSWLVSQAGGVGAVHHASINAAIAAIADLPSEEQPSPQFLHVIEVLPGRYEEFVWLPDWVYLKGISPIAVQLAGEDVSGSNKAILSIGMGGAENLAIYSQTVPDADAGLFVRNSTSAFTIHEDDFGTIGNGDTLEVTPAAFAKETFTFAGTETTAQNVTDLINATAINLAAIQRFGRVEIIHATLPATKGVIVHKEGTANAALGFSTTVDLNTTPPPTEAQLIDNIVILDKVVNGIQFSDRGGGIFIADRLIAAGATRGLYMELATELWVRNPFFFLNGTGILLESDSRLEIDGGKSNLNIGDDLEIQSNAVVVGKNFTYADRSGLGTLLPSGARLTFVWEVVGNLTTGTFIDGGRAMPFDVTIESVTMWRGVAGTPASSLIVDLNKAGSGGTSTTLYTTQANRPTITSTGVNNITHLAKLPDILKISQGEFLSIDIDAVEAGLSQHLNLIVTAVVN